MGARSSISDIKLRNKIASYVAVMANYLYINVIMLRFCRSVNCINLMDVKTFDGLHRCKSNGIIFFAIISKVIKSI